MSEIESCITSFVDGRVRLRHPSLKRAEDAEQVRGFLASLPGILRVTVNSRTGSLLLEYDPDQISREDLLALAGQWADFASAQDEAAAPRKRRFDRAQGHPVHEPGHVGDAGSVPRLRPCRTGTRACRGGRAVPPLQPRPSLYL